jgi:hypothetical protein
LRGKQIVAFKAFGVGSENVLSEEQIRKLCPFTLPSTDYVVMADFVVSKKVEGIISFVKQDSAERNKGLTPPKNGGKFTFRGSCFHLLISPPWQPIFKNNVYPS